MNASVTYCFIFARAGSKGLPGKNVKLLAGKPLLSYSITVAKAIPFIDKIFVSTDSPEITDIALTNNVIVISRPKELATDKASEFDAWRHAVYWAKNNYGDFENFISLPCTAPLRTLDSVLKCYKAFNINNPFVISVYRTKYNPFFNLVKKNEKNNSIELISSGNVVRRQDAPVVYCITPVAYIAKREEILNRTSLWDGKITGVEVSPNIAIDIDDLNDFLLAETIIKKNQNYNY